MKGIKKAGTVSSAGFFDKRGLDTEFFLDGIDDGIR